MRYFLITVLLLLTHSSLIACECQENKIAMEIYDSDVVFIGTAINKIYSADSSHYTIEFKISKYYKNNRQNVKFLKFTKISEFRYSGIESSCSWHLGIERDWLIIADYRNDEISFGVCSKSRPIDERALTTYENEILDNLHRFEISNYTFNHTNDFSNLKPLTNIDSLISCYANGIYKKQTQLLIFDVDVKGNLKAANLAPRGQRKTEVVDTIFDLNIYANIEYSLPKNNFEVAALKIARSIVKWIPKYYKRTGEVVPGRIHAYIIVNEKGKMRMEF